MRPHKIAQVKIEYLIKVTEKYPYKYDHAELSKFCEISRGEVFKLGNVLGLNVKGRETKNLRIEVEAYIKYKAKGKTAEQACDEIGCSVWVLYRVARKMKYRFETKYTTNTHESNRNASKSRKTLRQNAKHVA